jgi:hypothetical protein
MVEMTADGMSDMVVSYLPHSYKKAFKKAVSQESSAPLLEYKGDDNISKLPVLKV